MNLKPRVLPASDRNLSYSVELEGQSAVIAAEGLAPLPIEKPSSDPDRLRLLSYNIQIGIATRKYRQYFTQGWKHVLPSRKRGKNLDRIASFISDFDMVGLQEADAGSLRSDFTNQVEYLSIKAQFPFWYYQTNRRLGKIAQSSIGLLSRVPLSGVTEHRLPGTIPGRGLLVARLGDDRNPLVFLISHLALSRRARMRQIIYISRLVRNYPHVVLMGDLNFRSDSREMSLLLNKTGLREPAHGLHTFPSWHPQHNIDHILVSSSIKVDKAEVLECFCSDHLPISAHVSLPEELNLFEKKGDTDKNCY